MNKKLIVIGDLHIKEDEPFAKSFFRFSDWVEKQPWNNKDNTILFLGDIFHKYMPTPIENDLALYFFKNCLHVAGSIILCGNHDRKRKKNALEIFNSFKNITVIYKPIVDLIEQVPVLFLPHYDPHYYEELTTMKEDYGPEGVLNKSLVLDNVKYTFGHFSDVALFGSEIDISWIKTKKVLGHVHVSSSGSQFLGTPIITRLDEKGQVGKIMTIDIPSLQEDYLKVPVFLDYKTIKYGDKIEESNTLFLYDIEDAPDLGSAEAMYKDYCIHKILIKNAISSKIVEKEEKDDEKNIKEYVEDFFVVNKALPDKLKKRIKELVA